ncbi:Protein FAM22 [Cricetulus griseus]|uniref:Protein FAM22 n=1 Tax=Cricetulus griseus TaxID=10029 RepID=G3INK4_CRIGR|nr:Protein FAM22 [Cricetulus griseus]
MTLGTAVPLSIVQVATSGRPVQPMPNANIILTQLFLNCIVPVSQDQPQEGLWVLGSHPPTTQPVVQLVPIRSLVNSEPPPKGAVGENGPANVQTNSPENCLSKPDCVYGDIRHWQHIKTLVQQHLSRIPDM